MRRGVDLGRFYVAAVALLAVLLGLLFALVLRSTRMAVEQTAEELRRAASAKADDRVGQALAVAERAVAGIRGQLVDELVSPASPELLEAALYAELRRQPTLTEMTYTWPDGQLAVVRLTDGDGAARIVTRRRARRPEGWTLEVRPRPAGGGFTSARFVPGLGDGEDPTTWPTYTTPVGFKGAAVWSDLWLTDLDSHLPEDQRRVVMTVQQAVLGVDQQGSAALRPPVGGADGAPRATPLGVVRAGLLSDDIDRIGALRLDEANPADPHRIFLCDRRGQLITRLDPRGRLALTANDDVRVVSGDVPPAIAAALASPGLRDLSADQPLVVRAAGQVVTLSPLRDDRTQGWLVGVAVPESFYLSGLVAARNRLLAIAALLMVLVLVGGALSLRAIRAGLARVTGETARMRRFDFAPTAAATSGFADVNEALGSLEVAKTALRAMGRYVPIDLVRLLYAEGKEPILGGQLVDLSMMFTDIKDFTAVSETLTPDELASALGRYLEVMTRAIAGTGGTIDKFIGDAVMVFWNAPLPADDHARRACQAALRCQEALEELFDGPSWAGAGLPRWTTRFGLHRAEVMVGHYGAPERLSYTALGDGVNLASRLEGLNKTYGTTILASEAIRAAAGDAFAFRRLDRVAVKGKTEALWVHELLPAPPTPAMRRYEEALEIYRGGRFGEAVALLDGDDAPSARLAARCRELAAAPPALWDGVYRATEK